MLQPWLELIPRCLDEHLCKACLQRGHGWQRKFWQNKKRKSTSFMWMTWEGGGGGGKNCSLACPLSSEVRIAKLWFLSNLKANWSISEEMSQTSLSEMLAHLTGWLSVAGAVITLSGTNTTAELHHLHCPPKKSPSLHLTAEHRACGEGKCFLLSHHSPFQNC